MLGCRYIVCMNNAILTVLFGFSVVLLFANGFCSTRDKFSLKVNVNGKIIIAARAAHTMMPLYEADVNTPALLWTRPGPPLLLTKCIADVSGQHYVVKCGWQWHWACVRYGTHYVGAGECAPFTMRIILSAFIFIRWTVIHFSAKHCTMSLGFSVLQIYRMSMCSRCGRLSLISTITVIGQNSDMHMNSQGDGSACSSTTQRKAATSRQMTTAPT